MLLSFSFLSFFVPLVVHRSTSLSTHAFCSGTTTPPPAPVTPRETPTPGKIFLLGVSFCIRF